MSSILSPQALIACLVLLGIFGVRLMRERINAISVFAVVWAVVLITYQASPDLIPLSSRTLGFLTVAGISLSLGVCAATIVVPSTGARRPSRVARDEYLEAQAYRAYRLLNRLLALFVVLGVASIFPVLKSAGGITAIFSGSGLGFRRAYLAERLADTQAGFGVAGAIVGVVSYFAFVGMAALALAGYYAATGRLNRAGIPLGLTATYSLITLQRASFLYSLGIFLFSWFYYATLQKRKRSRSLANAIFNTKIRASALVLGIVLVVVVLVPILARRASGEDQAGVGAYLTSGLAGINSLSVQDSSLSAAATGALSPFPPAAQYIGFNLMHGHGSWTFQGLASILHRFGFPVDPSLASLTYIQTGAGDGSISNTYTFLIYFYYDGGIMGIAILSFLLGFVSSLLHRQVTVRGDSRFIMAASVAMTSLAMSFFGLSLVRDFRYWFVSIVSVMLVQHIMVRHQVSNQEEDVRR